MLPFSKPLHCFAPFSKPSAQALADMFDRPEAGVPDDFGSLVCLVCLVGPVMSNELTAAVQLKVASPIFVSSDCTSVSHRNARTWQS